VARLVQRHAAHPYAGPLAQRLYEAAGRNVELLTQFGRFPRRNAALGRTSTPDELAVLMDSGEATSDDDDDDDDDNGAPVLA
jgi:uncharacterized protein (DUF924 family)